MIKVTLKDILDGQETLQKLSGLQLPGRTAFQIGRLLKKLESVLAEYNETRTKLLEKYAKRTEDGNFELNDKNEYQFTQENIEIYIGEVNNLISEEIELDVTPIRLKDIENLMFTPSEMAILEPFMTE